MQASELRKKSVPELQEQINAFLKERFELRMQRSVGQLGQPHLIRQLGKDLARAKTVLNEKLWELGDGSGSQAPAPAPAAQAPGEAPSEEAAK